MSASSIPDGLSTSDLEKLLETATPDSSTTVDMTGEEMRELVSKEIETLTDKFGTIFGYKCVAMYCIQMIKLYHDDAALDHMKSGDFETGSAWSRDAGKLQAAFSDLIEVHCGPQDFTFSDDD
jgi:hypothetical protein